MAEGIAGIFTAKKKAQAVRAQANYEAQQQEFNAKLNEFQAQESIRQGESQVKQVRKESRQVVGAQRAALAAQGIDVSSGSAAQLQEDTVRGSTENVITIRNNAWREAWGYRLNGANQRSQAQFTRATGEYRAKDTILSSGINAVSGIVNTGLQVGTTAFTGGYSGIFSSAASALRGSSSGRLS